MLIKVLASFFEVRKIFSTLESALERNMKYFWVSLGHETYLIRKNMIDLVRKTYFGNAMGCDLAKIPKKLKMVILTGFFGFTGQSVWKTGKIDRTL